jgi:hypothetical protein
VVALVLQLDGDAPRFVEQPRAATRCGVALPLLALRPESPVLHLKAELALARHGLSVG